MYLIDGDDEDNDGGGGDNDDYDDEEDEDEDVDDENNDGDEADGDDAVRHFPYRPTRIGITNSTVRMSRLHVRKVGSHLSCSGSCEIPHC